MIRITSDEFIKIPKQELRGKVICFPTDTVYGIGAMFDDNFAIEAIYQLKRRDQNKPLALLASNVDQILPYIETNKMVEELMRAYWPGALTIIFKKKKGISDQITKGLPTVAFRIPNANVALKIINHLGIMATTSINISGEKPLNSEEEIKTYFNDEIDYFITDYQELSKDASTIIDVSSEDVKILRVGDIKIKIDV